MNPLLWLGWKKELNIQDMPKVLDTDEAKLLGDKLEHAWNKEHKHENKKAKLSTALYRVFGKDCLWSGILAFLMECCLKYILKKLVH